MMSYAMSRQDADKYIPQLTEILKKNAMHLISVVPAPEESDLKYATDLVIVIKGGDVATRVRSPGCRFRDFTIRTRTRYNIRTEIHKIRDGFAKWYLYAWTDADEKIESWILVDLDMVRKYGLLDIKRDEIPNTDGTKFISISIGELDTWGCVIDRHGLNKQPSRNPPVRIQQTLLSKQAHHKIYM